MIFCFNRKTVATEYSYTDIGYFSVVTPIVGCLALRCFGQGVVVALT